LNLHHYLLLFKKYLFLNLLKKVNNYQKREKEKIITIIGVGKIRLKEDTGKRKIMGYNPEKGSINLNTKRKNQNSRLKRRRIAAVRTPRPRPEISVVRRSKNCKSKDSL